MGTGNGKSEIRNEKLNRNENQKLEMRNEKWNEMKWNGNHKSEMRK